MRNRMAVVGLFALIVSLGFPLTALAQEENPGEPIRLAGEISSIQGTTIVVDTLRGDEQRVRVDDETQFRSLNGEIQSIEDLEAGSKVLVFGSLKGEIVFARVIAAGRLDRPNRIDRFRGEVVSLEADDSSFTLENREGRQATFVVTDDTQYHSSDGQLGTFGDITLGQHLAVISRGQEEKTANHILLLPEADGDRPHLNVRLRGELTGISESRLVIENVEGDRVTFLLTENTKVRKLGGEDLALGDRIRVVGFEDDQANKVAFLVVARPALPREFDSGTEAQSDLVPSSQSPIELPNAS